MWGKKTRDGAWFVVQFRNMTAACGERTATEMGFTYSADVKRLCFTDLAHDQIVSAVSGLGDVATMPESCLVEACIDYGLGAPLTTFTGKAHPLRIRAEARRYAEACIADKRLLAARLARPVNAIGTTADEYGRSDFLSALNRGPFTPEKNLMRKIAGRK
jgi:hypothetical protein